jgi:para-nitrobenzyl esterase
VPAYEYEFNDTHAPSLFPASLVSFPLGAYHGAELQYLFTLGTPAPLAPDQRLLAAAMVERWTAFARTGSPGTGWPRNGTAAGTIESLAPPRPALDSGFADDHRCAFWGRTPVNAE